MSGKGLVRRLAKKSGQESGQECIRTLSMFYEENALTRGDFAKNQEEGHVTNVDHQPGLAILVHI